MKRHTKKEIDTKWIEIRSDPDLIYHNGSTIFNYTGVLKDDNKMLYIEYVSKLAIDDFDILEKIGQNDLEYRSSKPFNMNHNGISNVKNRMEKYGKITFNGKSFAVALFNLQSDFIFGKIIDYELPLKEKISSRIGEIDLVSISGNEIMVIELKIGQSEFNKITETLLRAIMEAFTFSKILNTRKLKFLMDFDLSNQKALRPAILTLQNSICAKHMKMLQKGQLPYLKNLIEKINNYFDNLGILPFKFFSIQANNPELVLDENKRIIISDLSFSSSRVIEYFYD